jgi:hypothetical protein
MSTRQPERPADPADARDAGPWTVHALRQRWKPTKERLVREDRHEPIRIRVHRALSWLARVEELGEEAPLDATLIFRWIALNSLYGNWDEAQRQPIADRDSLQTFLERVLELDVDGRVHGVLIEHRRLVMSIFEDEYLTKYFWEEPTEERARKSQKTKFAARNWYLEGNNGLILWRVMERIYLLRCQLVHGAATFGGSLNRTALRRCCGMLGHLLTALLLVIIDHGAEEDWGPLCYPPQRK